MMIELEETIATIGAPEGNERTGRETEPNPGMISFLFSILSSSQSDFMPTI